MNDGKKDVKNSADLGGCYPPSLASVENTLLDLQNSSYPTKAKFNDYFIILLKKSFPVRKGAPQFHSLQLFFSAPNITQPWRHWFNMTKLLTSLVQYDKVLFTFGQQRLVMVNNTCGFKQAETGNILNEK